MSTHSRHQPRVLAYLLVDELVTRGAWDAQCPGLDHVQGLRTYGSTHVELCLMYRVFLSDRGYPGGIFDPFGKTFGFRLLYHPVLLQIILAHCNRVHAACAPAKTVWWSYRILQGQLQGGADKGDQERQAGNGCVRWCAYGIGLHLSLIAEHDLQ